MIYLVTNNPNLHSNENYQIISVEESLNLLKPLKIIGSDTETSGIDVHVKDLLSVQLGCYDFQVFIDRRTVDLQPYKELLEDPDKLFLFWNAKFDLKFFLKEGIVIPNVYDGYLAEKLLWLGYPTGMHPLSLKAAGQNYLGIELDKSVRGKIIYTTTLTEDIIIYGANDVKYLEQIYNKQMEALKEKDLVKAVKFENKFCPVLAYTEYCGVKLDETKWRNKMEKDQQMFDTALNELNNWVVDYYISHNGQDNKYIEEDFNYKIIGSTGHMAEFTPTNKFSAIGEPWQEEKNYSTYYYQKIRVEFPYVYQNLQGDLFTGFDTSVKCTINWSSPKQVAPFLQFLGFKLDTFDKKTKEKKISVGADVIEKQLDVSSIAPVYLKYKAAEKLIGTYGENIINQINPVTKRIHTNFNQIGTDTGRLSSGGKDKDHKVEYINFQNFPADKETRACFVSEPGYKWISCDYSAQESRIIGDLANDEAVLDLFNNGCGDMHSLVAKMAYKDKVGDCPVEEIKSKFKHWRQEAKGVEFSINYGGDANTIMSNKNIPLEEAQKIYNDYMEGFPGIKHYQETQRKFVMDHGYIILNDKIRNKAFIYDYDELKEIRKNMNTEGYWDTYRDYKKNNPNSPIVEEVRHYFRRKSAAEKQAINYKCQATGACMFKLASIYLFKYILEHNLLFKVKLCIPAHDEWNIEVPEEIADEMATVLMDCMKKAGAYFCTKLELPAEAEVADFWIH